MNKFKISTLFLISALVLAICVPTYANTGECSLMNYTNGVMPCYNAISSTSSKIYDSGGGNIVYSGDTTANNCKVAVYIELKQYINGDWVTIADGYREGQHFVSLSQSRWVDSGYSYCVKTTHYAYDNYGNLLDYVEKFSNSIYY